MLYLKQKHLIPILLIFFSLLNYAGISQNPGDTIKIQTFDYSSKGRDTLVQFPEGNLSYEKIILKYNMRCKEGLVSTNPEIEKGCGEWDYSCNTFIVDSSKVEVVDASQPSFDISGLNGNLEVGAEYHFSEEPIFDYYQYTLTNTTVNNIINEEKHTLNSDDTTDNTILKGSQISGKSHILYLASELTNAGVIAGEINGMELEVENAGGIINFLNISLKSTNDSVINPQEPETIGLVEVYNNNIEFTTGTNRIHFSTPYDWDGNSNILFELSYTNTTPQNDISFKASNEDNPLCMSTNNNFSIDFSQGGFIDIDPSHLPSIQNEMTVSFWTYGDLNTMPANTSIIWANAENASQRQLNIHLPWSDGSVYFDCGFDGGYDRISKIASPWSYKGRWTHWTFSKNSTSGIMKMFINGNLWTQTTLKYKDMNFLEMILGSNQNYENNYKGKLNEFRLWDKELTKDEVKQWYTRPITEEHPQYDHLVAYYPLQEGVGTTVNDFKNNVVSLGQSMDWNYERGTELSRNFSINSARPQVSLIQGNYNTSNTSVVVLDSIKRFPSTINTYSISSLSGTVQHDKIIKDNTYNYYLSTPSVIIDSETNDTISTIVNSTDHTFIYEELSYKRRFPFYNEIMSFVTPYGLGLDLGIDGKTWLFDVTDFSPILRGEKGMKMTMGGQYQEQFDIEFWFIVGTPPANILSFDQIYQGSNRLGSANIGDLYADDKMKEVILDAHPDGEMFKIKSTITGHGSEGEFEFNGGPVFHSIYLNDEEEFFWSVDTECSENPIYPQGGTWSIDRQGWCPGERSVLTEMDATELITPGAETSFNYAITQAVKPSGDYRYLMSHQLIAYGAPNHSLDVAISDVISPTNNVLHSRINPSCVNPIITIKNTGAEELTTATIEYWINDELEKETFQFEGSLAFMETVDIELPVGNLYVNSNAGNNVFHAHIKQPNEGTDEYPHNDIYHVPFTQADKLPDEFIIEIKTNSRPFENSYKIYDHNDEVILFNTLPSANTVYRDTIRLNGCYKIELNDTGDDGLEWWANTSQGVGYARLKNINGSTFKTFNPDFGGILSYGFSTKSVNSVKIEQNNFDISVSPNPAHDKFIIVGKDLKNLDVTLFDIMGTRVATPSVYADEFIQFEVKNLSPGLYIISLSDDHNIATKKIVIE